jgi:hypothetical protein
MRWLPIAIAMLGCGGTPRSSPGPDNSTQGIPPPASEKDEKNQAEMKRHAELCAQATSLAALGCTPFDQMDPSLLKGDCAVVTSFQMASMDHCLNRTSCELLTECFTTTRSIDDPLPYSGPTRACELPKDHADLALPAGFTADEIAKSHGATAKSYADAPSTKDKPIEVCGFPAAGVWLSRMTCADGSRPLPTRNDAERVRVGNVGDGGRCGRIIDQYQVECPEMTYDIFIDAYRCPQ